jgi:hypothetical protein
MNEWINELINELIYALIMICHNFLIEKEHTSGALASEPSARSYEAVTTQVRNS